MHLDDINVAIEEKCDLEALLAQYVNRLELEIEQGWRAYHVCPLWFKLNLPAPLINTAGKLYSLNSLCLIYAKQRFDHDLAERFDDETSELRLNYRNYLEPMVIADMGVYPSRTVFWDVAANELVPAIEEGRGESFGTMLTRWGRELDVEDAGRAQMLYREIDIGRFEVDSISMNFASKEMLLCLMKYIAPQWEYVSELSKKKQLIFRKPFTDKFDWIIEFYADGRVAIDCARWGLASAGLKRPLSRSNFVDLSFDRAGSSIFSGQSQHVRCSKIYVLDEKEEVVLSSTWQTGGDLMHKIPNFESWMDFFAPLLMEVCS